MPGRDSVSGSLIDWTVIFYETTPSLFHSKEVPGMVITIGVDGLWKEPASLIKIPTNGSIDDAKLDMGPPMLSARRRVPPSAASVAIPAER